jgi:hypothetical protein
MEKNRMKLNNGVYNVRYVLIAISGEVIDQVKFYNDPTIAVKDLTEFVKTMNPEKDDAAIYYLYDLIAYAKDFLDENNQFIQDVVIPGLQSGDYR